MKLKNISKKLKENTALKYKVTTCQNPKINDDFSVLSHHKFVIKR